MPRARIYDLIVRQEFLEFYEITPIYSSEDRNFNRGGQKGVQIYGVSYIVTWMSLRRVVIRRSTVDVVGALLM